MDYKPAKMISTRVTSCSAHSQHQQAMVIRLRSLIYDLALTHACRNVNVTYREVKWPNFTLPSAGTEWYSCIIILFMCLYMFTFYILHSLKQIIGYSLHIIMKHKSVNGLGLFFNTLKVLFYCWGIFEILESFQTISCYFDVSYAFKWHVICYIACINCRWWLYVFLMKFTVCFDGRLWQVNVLVLYLFYFGIYCVYK